MASYINSEPSTAGTTLPTNAGTLIRSDEWGIDNTLSDFIIQNESIQEETITDQTQDQKGSIVSELDYDHHWTLSLDLIGDTAAGDALFNTTGDYTILYGGHYWKLKSVSYTGAYNDKKKWSITAERWINFPEQPANT